MQDKLVYHEDAILYNESVAKEAESLNDRLRDPEIKKWARAVAKQHRHHLKRHRSALRKLQAGEEPESVEILPEGLDVPPLNEEESNLDAIPVEVPDTRSVAEQQAEFAAEMSSQEATAEADAPDVNYHDAGTGQFVSEEYAKEHPDTTVGVTETSAEQPMKAVKPNPTVLDKKKQKPSMYYNSKGESVTQAEYEAEQAAEENANG